MVRNEWNTLPLYEMTGHCWAGCFTTSFLVLMLRLAIVAPACKYYSKYKWYNSE